MDRPQEAAPIADVVSIAINETIHTDESPLGAAPITDVGSLIAPYLDKLNGHRQRFEESRARHASLIEQVATQEKAAQAAEAEGEAAKLQLREIIRDLNGRPSKKLYDLKAAERAAYSLADEYRSFGKDIAIERDRASIDAHEAASSYRSELLHAMGSVGDQLMEIGIEKLPIELLAGYFLKKTAQANTLFSEWTQLPFHESAGEYVITLASRKLRGVLKRDHSGMKGFLPPEFSAPLDTNGFIKTHLGIKKLRDDLAERERNILGQGAAQ